MPKLLIKKEVSTHLVGASTGSSAQPPCRRGGLGGGSFKRGETRYSQLQSSRSQAISDTRFAHTKVTTYQTERQCLRCCLIINKRKRYIAGQFFKCLCKQKMYHLSTSWQVAGLCVFDLPKTQRRFDLQRTRCSRHVSRGTPSLPIFTFQLGASHFTCLLGHRSGSTPFRQLILDEESFPQSVCFSPWARIGS